MSQEESLREEYTQCWEDFRYRTTQEAAILTIYFAVAGALLYVLFGMPTSDMAKFGISVVGTIFSAAIVAILLGERTAWGADIERLWQLEDILSSGSPKAPLARVREFETLWRREGYRIKRRICAKCRTPLRPTAKYDLWHCEKCNIDVSHDDNKNFTYKVKVRSAFLWLLVAVIATTTIWVIDSFYYGSLVITKVGLSADLIVGFATGFIVGALSIAFLRYGSRKWKGSSFTGS